MARALIDRTLHAPAVIGLPASNEPVVRFARPDGQPPQCFDLSPLDFPTPVRDAFAAAMRVHLADKTMTTRRTTWRALRYWAQFCREVAVADAGAYTAELMGRYIGWLNARRSPDGKPWSKSTKYQQLTMLRPLVTWIQQHRPGLWPARFSVPYNPFPRKNQTAVPRAQLSADALKTLLRQCYREIRAVKQQHQAGSLGRINADHLTPFYLAILTQTAGNPEAIRELRRDCLVPHPLDAHRVLVEWTKRRAGHGRYRCHRRSFDRRKRYAAPNLIDTLLGVTEDIAKRARGAHRQALFLLDDARAGAPAQVSTPGLYHAVQRFQARARSQQQGPPSSRLPPFALASLRGSAASAQFAASGGDLRTVQRLLNHRGASTTLGYIDRAVMERLVQQEMARLQAHLVSWLTGAPAVAADDAPAIGQAIACAHHAGTFSHRCTNPLAGTAPASRRGRLCAHFFGCLTCPGLVIPVSPESFARALHARQHLARAQLTLDPARWSALYAPVAAILETDVLPVFPAAMRPAAEALLPTLPPLPPFE